MSADLVVGADGIHSAVRRQLYQDVALYSGKIAYRGVVPVASLPSPWPFDSYSVIWVSRDKHFLIFPISKNKYLNIVAFVTKGESEIADLQESWWGTCDRRELEEDFADCEELVKKIISLVPERTSKWRINDRDPAGQWTYMDGKVVLLGDAAHPMVPHQGAGAGQAVEEWVRARKSHIRLSPGAGRRRKRRRLGQMDAAVPERSASTGPGRADDQ